MPRRLALSGAVAVGVLWFAVIVVTPLAVARASAGDRARGLTALAYLTGSLVCHQQDARSFHTAGVPWPVCARCAGLYAGGALGLLAAGVWGGVRRRWSPVLGSRTVLLAVAAPTLFTVATGMLGWWDPANSLRSALAVPLGAVIGVVLAAVAAGDLR
ncbi:MAG: DUF2085 domain-containing protein [Vicinamibacterales bacterium]